MKSNLGGISIPWVDRALERVSKGLQGVPGVSRNLQKDFKRHLESRLLAGC